MDLVFDDATTAFRDEVRSFLEANVPATPLKSMDTAEGFEEHRQWEHTLADAATPSSPGPRNSADAMRPCSNGSSSRRSTTARARPAA